MIAVRRDTPQLPPQLRPTFVHGSWRTGSTYVWTKFRQDQAFLAFGEPFHENLAVVTERDLSARPTDATMAHLHHPQVDMPYYGEYAPLLTERGIRHFLPRFSYRDFFLNDGPALRDQERYIGTLLGLAEASGARAMLGFCRSRGRAAWMRRRFADAAHILLLRDPVQQWCSFEEQWHRYDNPYFVTMSLLMLAAAEPDTVPGAAARHVGLAHLPAQDDVYATYRTMLDVVADLPPERVRVGALLFIGIELAVASSHVELLLDLDRASADADYRVSLEQALYAATGATLDLSDAALPRHVVVGPDVAAAVEEVSEWLDGVGQRHPWPDEAAGSAVGRVTSLLARGLESARA